MLITKEIEIKLTKKNKLYYESLGYDVNNDNIIVKVEDVQKESEKEIQVMCDYCHKVITKTIAKYNRGHANGVFKDSCDSCRSIKAKETYLMRYGVDNPMKNDVIKQKMIESINDKYGVDNVASLNWVITKRKNTNLSKYGVDNPMKNDTIKSKHHINQMYNNKTKCIASTPQIKYCEMFNGKLNVPIGTYFADIIVNDNIVVEYDGSGHDMCVRMNSISYEEFCLKEKNREIYFIEQGYKIIRLITHKDIIYNTTTATKILNLCISFLNNNNTNIVRYDLDANTIVPETTE